jgi:hypothetical protein
MKAFTLTCLAGLILLIGGCGYNIGYLGHPQIESIAVAPVTNKTAVYNVAAVMRGMFTEAFNVDGTYSLKNLREADCILYANVLEFTTRKVVDTADDEEVVFRVVEWEASVTVEFTVIIPGRKEPVIKTRTVTGSCNFQSSGDMETSRRNGARLACYQAAQTIVQYTTEGW